MVVKPDPVKASSSISDKKLIDCPICPFQCFNIKVLETHVSKHLDEDAETALACEVGLGLKEPGRRGGIALSAAEKRVEANHTRGGCLRRSSMDSWDHYDDESRKRPCRSPNRRDKAPAREEKDSSLVRTPDISEHLQEELLDKGIQLEEPNFTPSIRSIQTIIERAWKDGFDKAGAAQLENQLVNTQKWIGATEAMVYFIYLGIRVELKDFPKPTGKGGSHPALLDFVEAYFDGSLEQFDNERKRQKHYPCDFKRNFQESDGFITTSMAPLYLQHRYCLALHASVFNHVSSGHSRTIVGIQILNDERNLLVLDPVRRLPSSVTKITESNHFDRPIDHQITADQLLKSLRLPMTELSQHKQYQILQVSGFGWRSSSEREKAFTLSSSRIV
ncbi:hypothetical protein HDU67_010310 [Dinochytrium kinnereticum]|nr:hypothetical protein HDU67_010310 [Dinochytrium kinnereticum]